MEHPLIDIFAPPPSLSETILNTKCPLCEASIIPICPSLMEVLYICSNDKCLFPFEEDDIDVQCITKQLPTYISKEEINISITSKRSTPCEEDTINNPKRRKITPNSSFHSISSSSSSFSKRPVLFSSSTCLDPSLSKLRTLKQNFLKPLSSNDTITYICEFLEELKGGGWFSDEVINSYLKILSRTYKRTAFLNSFVTLAKNSKVWTSTLKTIQSFQTGLIDQIVFPFHVPGHWTLVSINHNGTYYLLDSLGELYDEIPALKKFLSTHLSFRTWKFSTAFKKNNIHQKDTQNCGAYIIYYAKSIAEGKTLTQIDNLTGTIHISQLRETILSEIQNEIRINPSFQKEFTAPRSGSSSPSSLNSPIPSLPSSPDSITNLNNFEMEVISPQTCY